MSDIDLRIICVQRNTTMLYLTRRHNSGARYGKATGLIAVARFVLLALHFPNPLTTLQPFRSLPASSNTYKTPSLASSTTSTRRDGVVVGGRGIRGRKAWQSMIMDICISMGNE